MTEDNDTTTDTPAEEPISASEPQEEAVVEEPLSGTSEPDSVPEPQPTRVPARVSWWPFGIYALLWLGLITATVYVLAVGPQASLPAVSQDHYPLLLLGLLVMTLLGPLLAVIVWFVVWLRADAGLRHGLFTISFVRGSILTFVGVVLWFGALVAVDAIRLGLIVLPQSLS